MQEQLLNEKAYREKCGTPRNDVMVATFRAGPVLSIEDQTKVLRRKGLANVTADDVYQLLDVCERWSTMRNPSTNAATMHLPGQQQGDQRRDDGGVLVLSHPQDVLVCLRVQGVAQGSERFLQGEALPEDVVPPGASAANQTSSSVRISGSNGEGISRASAI